MDVAVTDQDIEVTVSRILRAGVVLSGSFVLLGGIYFLVRHGSEPANFKNFVGQPAVDRIAHEIVLGAVRVRARSIVQLGILILIGTPILRVGVSLVDFAFERDWKYVWITAIVLGVLLFSLVSGAAGG
jgi:uncharacterized membrane protein